MCFSGAGSRGDPCDSFIDGPSSTRVGAVTQNGKPTEPDHVPAGGSYRQLDPERIVATVERLHRRVNERFPGSGLSRVSEELLAVARQAKERALSVARPLMLLRIGLGVVVGAIIVAAAATATWIAWQKAPSQWSDFAQGLDAAL